MEHQAVLKTPVKYKTSFEHRNNPLRQPGQVLLSSFIAEGTLKYQVLCPGAHM